ncbi:hypothetical protein F4818DRAFT_304882 [Hypoxylon cercidicola]|nr:hypothetical protein F4818DRAFT_304882 [Hypoxylon cercidicola]
MSLTTISAMDRSRYLFQQCQYEECDATVLLGGPYCEVHRSSKGLPRPPAALAPSPGQRQPNGYHSSKQSLSQLRRSPANMDTQEKTGDAITVKTPFAVPGSTSEKKQLPDKKVARKTTSAGVSKQTPTATATRNQGFRQSVNRSSTGDTASSDKRSPKRPRLSTEINATDKETRHGVPFFTNSTSHAPPHIKTTNSEERDIEITAISDFSLHPRKAHSSLLEAPPANRQRGGHEPITKPSRKDPPRKLPLPANVIDLTGDDPQPELPPRQNSHSNGQKGRDNSSSGANTQTKETLPDSRHEGKSIEVQFTANQAYKSTGDAHTAVRTEPHHARKTASNTPTHVPLQRFTPINIAPRPDPTLLPSNEGNPQPTMMDDKQKPPQYSSSYAVRPVDPPRQNGKQVPTNGVGAAGMTGSTNHTVTNHHPAPIAPTPTSTTSTSSANGGRSEPRVAESTPQPSKEQIKAYIQEILTRPTNTFTAPVNVNSRESRTTNSDASLPRPESPVKPSPACQPQSKEPNLPKSPNVLEQRTIDSHSSTQHHHTIQKPPQSSSQAFQHVGELNGTGRVADAPIGKSALASLFPKRNWKSLNPEERRQALIAQHDPVKFDSYIYGKLNEPNRPGSALFGLPEYQQPPRPTRPATHFAHIDPRVHWTRPRSEKWYREKQDEIRKRGTRKSNFGRAAASAARRRQKEEEDNVRVDLPERVKNNPAWLAAIDELDEMADQYHAQQREKARRRASEQIRKEKEKEIVNDSDDEMEDVSP